MSISKAKLEESWEDINGIISSIEDKCYIPDEGFRTRHFECTTARISRMSKNLKELQKELERRREILLDLFGESSKKHHSSLILARNNYQDLFSIMSGMAVQITDDQHDVIAEVKNLKELRDKESVCQMQGMVEIRHLVFEGVFTGRDILRN